MGVDVIAVLFTMKPEPPVDAVPVVVIFVELCLVPRVVRQGAAPVTSPET
jgi:hypothetical protein